MIKSKNPLLISLQAESTDRPLHLSERRSVGLQHTPLTQTFSSNKLTHSAASSRPGETLVRYRMMLEYTLHSNLIFFFKRRQVFFFASKIFSLLVGTNIYSTVDSQCEDDQPLFHSWRATHTVSKRTHQVWHEPLWFVLHSVWCKEKYRIIFLGYVLGILFKKPWHSNAEGAPKQGFDWMVTVPGL